MKKVVLHSTGFYITWFDKGFYLAYSLIFRLTVIFVLEAMGDNFAYLSLKVSFLTVSYPSIPFSFKLHESTLSSMIELFLQKLLTTKSRKLFSQRSSIIDDRLCSETPLNTQPCWNDLTILSNVGIYRCSTDYFPKNFGKLLRWNVF